MIDILQIEPTRNCNLKCKHCNRDKHHGSIEYTTYKQLLDEYKGIIPWVKLQGLGEPYLFNELNEYSQLAIGMGYKTMVITNGTIPILECAFHRIIFSIDTLDKSRYYDMRGTDLGPVLNNLLYCVNEGWPVEINCVKTKYNTPEDIVEIKAFAKKYNIPINIVPCEVWVDPCHKDYASRYADALEAYRIHGDDPKIIGRWSETCTWGLTSLYYDYRGYMHPCCIRMTDEYIIDDIETYDFKRCCLRCPL